MKAAALEAFGLLERGGAILYTGELPNRFVDSGKVVEAPSDSPNFPFVLKALNCLANSIMAAKV